VEDGDGFSGSSGSTLCASSSRLDARLPVQLSTVSKVSREPPKDMSLRLSKEVVSHVVLDVSVGARHFCGGEPGKICSSATGSEDGAAGETLILPFDLLDSLLT